MRQLCRIHTRGTAIRLVRHGAPGAETPLLSAADGVGRGLRRVVDGLTPGTLPAVLAGVDPHPLPVVAEPGRFGPPLSGIGKIVCIGPNYRQRAAETGAAVPEESIVFLKTPDTAVGPDDRVLIPAGPSRPTTRSNSPSSSAARPAT